MIRAAAPPRRVLMLVENNSYPKDPRVRKEAQALMKAGYLITVISPAEPRQKWHEMIDGVNVYRFPASPQASSLLSYLYEYAYSMAAISLLAFWVFLRHGFDVIHAANPPDTLAFVAAFYKCLGKHFVFDHHDLAPEMYYARFPQGGNKWVHKALLWCERLSCRIADRVLAVNESYKAIEMRRDGVLEASITVVRNGPELRNTWTNESDRDLRAQAGTIIAYAGIIGVQDGVDCLLRVLRNLIVTLNRTDVLCLILGDGEALPSLRHQADKLAVAQYIRFTGWIDDPGRYARCLATADICVDPSPSNPYNDRCTAIKMMEYMAAAKPIVAFDLPEHRVTAESSALYAPPNDELGFARAIAELMNDAPRRQIMGAIGRQRIEHSLAWSYSAARLLDAYSNLLFTSPRTSARIANTSSAIRPSQRPAIR
jgi:glycosyltransferase involved in cell wall biosynthesis